MTREQLADQLLALPLGERVALAQTLWQSINEASDIDSAEEERVAIAQASRRDAELTSGTVIGRTHDQVMEAAARTLKCG